jgi:hypothetical protein
MLIYSYIFYFKQAKRIVVIAVAFPVMRAAR